jgi:diguanylate cyclase (GGDEF)-like protein
LEVANPTLDSIALYRPGANTPTPAGDRLPFSERPLRHINFVFPLSDSGTGAATVFVRVQNEGTLLVPLVLWSPEAFAESSRLTYAGQAAYFGALLAMLIYNALLWLSLRERVYLEYVLYVAFLGIGLGAANGMAAQFFWPDSTWLVHFSYFGFGPAGVFVTQFARSFLNTRTTSVWLDRSLIGVGIASAASTLMAAISYQTAGLMVSASLIMAMLLSGWAGIYSLTHKVPGGRLYLASWSVFLVFAMMLPLRNFGLVANNVLSAFGVQIGSLAEMMLLSFALAARINHIRAEKVNAQQAALDAQAQLVVNLRESEQVLEQRVAQRTELLEQANRLLSAMSITDDLTGIANRRHFEDALAAEWKRMQRLGQPLALAMIDIDWFKKYNDHYGHQAGDACLVAVAGVLAASIGRSGDLVARYGGEEFVFIAPATQVSNALAMGQKICDALSAKDLPHVQSAFGRVTASIGVAAIVPSEEGGAALLLKHADEALYQAKAEGRNRVVLYQAEDSIYPLL